MEFGLTHALTTIKLNLMIDSLVHIFREQLLIHIMTTDGIVCKIKRTQYLLFPFIDPTNFDVTLCNQRIVVFCINQDVYKRQY